MRLIQAFTREAGVRNLEREIANVARKVARRVAADAKTKVVVKPEDARGRTSDRRASTTASSTPRTRSAW